LLMPWDYAAKILPHKGTRNVGKMLEEFGLLNVEMEWNNYFEFKCLALSGKWHGKVHIN